MPVRSDRGGARSGVWVMLLALVVAAFLGGGLGLVWQSASQFAEDDEDEIVTVETPTPE